MDSSTTKKQPLLLCLIGTLPTFTPDDQRSTRVPFTPIFLLNDDIHEGMKYATIDEHRAVNIAYVTQHW